MFSVYKMYSTYCHYCSYVLNMVYCPLHARGSKRAAHDMRQCEGVQDGMRGTRVGAGDGGGGFLRHARDRQARDSRWRARVGRLEWRRGFLRHGERRAGTQTARGACPEHSAGAGGG